MSALNVLLPLLSLSLFCLVGVSGRADGGDTGISKGPLMSTIEVKMEENVQSYLKRAKTAEQKACVEKVAEEAHLEAEQKAEQIKGQTRDMRSILDRIVRQIEEEHESEYSEESSESDESDESPELIRGSRDASDFAQAQKLMDDSATIEISEWAHQKRAAMEECLQK